jgi:hypothetical protein
MYYASMPRCWQLIWILIRTNHSCLRVGRHIQKARKVRELLAVFERSSGQKLSPSKCSLLIPEGADSAMELEVRQILGIERACFDENYLGLPLPMGRLKSDNF